jgi:type IV pilus assembly protein PilM
MGFNTLQWINMFESLRLKPDAFGIDISDFSVRLIKLKKTSQDFELDSYNEEAVKPGVIENGDIRDKKELSKAIKKLLNNVEGAPLKTHYASVSLPEKKSFLKVIKMPKMSAQDLGEAVYFEIENHIPLRVEDVYFDFEVIPPYLRENNIKDKKNYLEILFAAIPKTTVDSYNYCLKGIGIQPVHFEVESFSLARSLINRNEKPGPVLLINLGADKTSLVFFSNGFARFTCSSSVCSQTFTQSISRFLNVDLKKAEKLKEQYGFEAFKSQDSGKSKKTKSKKSISEKHQVFQALIPGITDLTEQIKKYIDFYKFSKAGDDIAHDAAINKIILSGGGVCLKNIDKFLESEIGIPVEIGNPWVNVSKRPLLPLLLSYKYTIAIGLALGATEQYA